MDFMSSFFASLHHDGVILENGRVARNWRSALRTAKSEGRKFSNDQMQNFHQLDILHP